MRGFQWRRTVGMCVVGVYWGDSIEHWGLVTFISGLLPNSCYCFVSDFENHFFF